MQHSAGEPRWPGTDIWTFTLLYCTDACYVALLSSLHTLAPPDPAPSMRTSLLSALAALLWTAACASDTKKAPKPCTAVSPTTDRFFDLNPLHRTPPEEGKKKKDGDEGSWHARGHDYGANFTINFCGPVVEELNDVQDLDKALWRNVSAFYERDGKQYALG